MQDVKRASSSQVNTPQPMKLVHGRTFNGVNNIYYLPSDPEEWERLNKRNEALIIGMGDIYPCPELVEAILAPVDDAGPKQVLDAGCGTGIWALEMASRFPHTQVTAIDMSPLPALPSRPSNFSFEIQDLNNDLSRYYDRFDLINLRNVLPGIKDVEKALKELELCLKPGGLLIVMEGDLPVQQDKEMCMKLAKLEGESAGAVDANGSWLCRVLAEVDNSHVSIGMWKQGSNEVADLGPWDHKLCDPEWSASGSMYVPIGPWAEGSNPEETLRLKRAGQLMSDNLLQYTNGAHASLMSYGMDQETLDRWSKNVEEELNEMKHKMWVRFRFFWTRKRAGEGLPAPPLPNYKIRRPTASGDAKSAQRSSTLEVYYDKEETLARMKKRMEPIQDLPVFAVESAWKAKQEM